MKRNYEKNKNISNNFGLKKIIVLVGSRYPEALKNLEKFLDCLKDFDLSTLDLSIYRVKEDLFCNIAGVRNLSAKECKTEWMVILDMDTIITSKLASSMLNLCDYPSGTCFKFNRRVPKRPFHNKNGQQHPAVCLLRKKEYWSVGGCDEDLVGNYGQTDPIFWYRAKDKLKIISCMDMFLEYIPEGEASIKRNKEKNFKLFQEKKNNNNWAKDFIRFDWEKIY